MVSVTERGRLLRISSSCLEARHRVSRGLVWGAAPCPSPGKKGPLSGESVRGSHFSGWASRAELVALNAPLPWQGTGTIRCTASWKSRIDKSLSNCRTGSKEQKGEWMLMSSFFYTRMSGAETGMQIPFTNFMAFLSSVQRWLVLNSKPHSVITFTLKCISMYHTVLVYRYF